MSKNFTSAESDLTPLRLESYDHGFFDNQIMTVNEMAAFLRVSSKSIYRKALKGEIPSVRVGRAYRFLYPEILQWLKQGGHHGQGNEI